MASLSLKPFNLPPNQDSPTLSIFSYWSATILVAFLIFSYWSATILVAFLIFSYWSATILVASMNKSLNAGWKPALQLEKKYLSINSIPL